MNSHNQVRGHRTGFLSHSGVEECPREETQRGTRIPGTSKYIIADAIHASARKNILN